MSNSAIYLLIVCLVMGGLFLFGLITSRNIKDAEDWAVAGKGLGIIPLSGTYFATIISATSIVSYLGFYYLNGWSGMWNFAGTLVTSFVACLWVAKRMRRTECTTVPEYIERRFGKTHSLLASIIILIGASTLMAAQVKASVIILQAIVDWDTILCCVIVMAVFIAFTALGGMKAVAWTDTICAYVIIIGIWLMAIKYLGIVGGWSGMMEGIAAIDEYRVAAFSPNIPPIAALGWTVTWGICNFGAPQFVGRFLTATTPESASRSQGLTAVMLGIFYLPLVIVGVSGLLVLPGIERQDLVYSTLVTQTLPPVIGGIMFAAVMAAIISTADSMLLLASTTWTVDIYKKYINPKISSKRELLMARTSTVLIGVISIVLIFVMEDVIQNIQAKAVTLMGSAMAMLVLIGAFNKKITKTGALASMIAGFVTACIWYALGQPGGVMAALPGCLVSAIVMLAVSAVTKPMTKEELAPFFPEEVEKS